MKVTDEETGEESYDFPVTIYNAAGSDYKVPNLEALEYHLLNGWSIEKPDPAEEIAATVGEARESDIIALTARVVLLEKMLSDLNDKIATSAVVKAQGAAIAKMAGDLVEFRKVLNIAPPRSVPPPKPPTPAAQEPTK